MFGQAAEHYDNCMTDGCFLLLSHDNFVLLLSQVPGFYLVVVFLTLYSYISDGVIQVIKCTLSYKFKFIKSTGSWPCTGH